MKHALPIVGAGQARAVALTSAYLSKRLDLPPMGLTVPNLVGANVRNGTDPETVYKRAFIQTWAELAKSGDYQKAIQIGLNRIESSAEMDIALSARAATLDFGSMSTEEITGWVRVADGDACAFCSEIDGAVTGPDEPQPLHDRCGCTSDPITRNIPAPDGADSVGVGDTVGDTEIQEHGELGPVITRRGDNFTSEADLGE